MRGVSVAVTVDVGNVAFNSRIRGFDVEVMTWGSNVIICQVNRAWCGCKWCGCCWFDMCGVWLTRGVSVGVVVVRPSKHAGCITAVSGPVEVVLRVLCPTTDRVLAWVEGVRYGLQTA